MACRPFPQTVRARNPYALAALMAVLIIVTPMTLWILVWFSCSAVYVAIEETLEDSLCAELVGEEHHGMRSAFLRR